MVSATNQYEPEVTTPPLGFGADPAPIIAVTFGPGGMSRTPVCQLAGHVVVEQPGPTTAASGMSDPPIAPPVPVPALAPLPPSPPPFNELPPVETPAFVAPPVSVTATLTRDEQLKAKSKQKVQVRERVGLR
jgi:hypothetical protein